MVCRFRALLRSFRVRICPNPTFCLFLLGNWHRYAELFGTLVSRESGSVLALESVDEVLDSSGDFLCKLAQGPRSKFAW